MGILPEDKPVKPKLEPHNFFIYGKPMAGKSYFASFFPHPLVLNTDGNANQGTAPNIQLVNKKDKTGKIVKTARSQVEEAVLALQTQSTTFQTIIIDTIEDLCVLVEQAICAEYGVKSLNDGKLSYGKGSSIIKQFLQDMVMDLKALPMDVIFISREIEVADIQSGSTEIKSALKDNYYNIVTGNCDLVIRCQKTGKDHIRTIEEKRADYKPSDISNEQIRKLLASCFGMFN
jgi:hypothetical protein